MTHLLDQLADVLPLVPEGCDGHTSIGFACHDRGTIERLASEHSGGVMHDDIGAVCWYDYTRRLTVQVSYVEHDEPESDTRTSPACDHCGFPTSTPPDQRGGRYCCDRCRRSDEANPARSA